MIAFLSAELGIDAASLTLETSFVDDLMIDSLDVLRIAAGLDADFGIQLPAELLPEIRTVADLHYYVATVASHSGR